MKALLVVLLAVALVRELDRGQEENLLMSPKVLANMLSNYLYERRFGPYFTEPSVAGINPVTNKPEVYEMDLIGCVSKPRDFVTTGIEADTFMGMAESVWELDMDKDAVFEACTQTFLSGMERIGSSGWDGVFYTLTPDTISKSLIKGQSVQAGGPVFTAPASSIADGLSIPTLGCNAFASASTLLDHVCTVTEDDIARAMLRMIEEEKSVVEGSGLVGIASLFFGTLQHYLCQITRHVVFLLCGGNIDTTV